MLTQTLQNIMDTAVANEELAGISLLLVRSGKEECYLQSGAADRETGTPIRRDNIFRLYSQSKPITAAAAMLLMERGLIDLYDRVDSYLPGFADAKVLTKDGTVAANRPIYISDLLSMTAGLSYPAEDAAGLFADELFKVQQSKPYDEQWDTYAFCNEMGKLPLAFQPGEHFRYSTCADVLGAVVEAASGQRFSDFLQENLFDPLEMPDTGFWVPEEKQHRFATCYEKTDAGLVPYRKIHLAVGDYSRPPKFESGGAGMVSTLDDYQHFAAMLLNHGEWNGRQILRPATVDYMTKGQLDPFQLHHDMWPTLKGYNYGKLMRIGEHPGWYGGMVREGEYGWDGWLGTYFANFPREQMSLLLMLNLKDAGTTPTTRKLRNVILTNLP